MLLLATNVYTQDNTRGVTLQYAPTGADPFPSGF